MASVIDLKYTSALVYVDESFNEFSFDFIANLCKGMETNFVICHNNNSKMDELEVKLKLIVDCRIAFKIHKAKGKGVAYIYPQKGVASHISCVMLTPANKKDLLWYTQKHTKSDVLYIPSPLPGYTPKESNKYLICVEWEEQVEYYVNLLKAIVRPNDELIFCNFYLYPNPIQPEGSLDSVLNANDQDNSENSLLDRQIKLLKRDGEYVARKGMEIFMASYVEKDILSTLTLTYTSNGEWDLATSMAEIMDQQRPDLIILGQRKRAPTWTEWFTDLSWYWLNGCLLDHFVASDLPLVAPFVVVKSTQ